MFVIFGAMIVIALYKLRIHKKGLDERYLSIPYTSSIKGIFILFVFLSHARSYTHFTFVGDTATIQVMDYLGQLMVALFLFYSGYGVYESIKRKGQKYIDQFPKNRIAKTFVDFSFAIVLFYILGECLGNHHTLSQFLLSLTGWISIGNSNWYMFAIFMMYILSYVCLKLFSKHRFAGMITMSGATLGYIYVLSLLQPARFSNTVLCYLAGMWYSYFKEDIDDFLNQHISLYYILLAFVFFVYLYIYPMKSQNIMMHNIVSVVFCIVIVLASMKISIQSQVFEWCGKHLFWIYILQRIPMNILKNIGIHETMPYVFIFVSFGLTLIMAYYAQIWMTKVKQYIFH